MKYKVLKTFKAKVNGEIIEFKEGQEITIPGEKAVRLIEMGKIEVAEETFESIFKDTVHELNREYPQGLVDHIRQKHSGLWNQSVQAENRINWLWDKDLEAFKKAVSDWREIELAMIRLFKEN